jgi:hypothetical protein
MPTAFKIVLDRLTSFQPAQYSGAPSGLWGALGYTSAAAELARYFFLKDISFFADVVIAGADTCWVPSPDPPPPVAIQTSYADYNFAASSGGALPVNIDPLARCGYGPGGFNLGATTDDIIVDGVLVTHGGNISFGLTWLNWSAGQWALAPWLSAATLDGSFSLLASPWTLDVLMGADYATTYGTPPSFPFTLINSTGYLPPPGPPAIGGGGYLYGSGPISEGANFTYADYLIGNATIWGIPWNIYGGCTAIVPNFVYDGGEDGEGNQLSAIENYNQVLPLSLNPAVANITVNLGISDDDYWQPGDFA